MGKILPKFKASVAEDFISSISEGVSHYYAFAANPVENTDGIPEETLDRQTAYFENNWRLLFGKKLSNTDIVPVIDKITWASNTVYDRYDNTQDLSNSQFYVMTEPTEPGGSYHVFKCIDNANGDPATEKPDQVQASSFTKSDGYTWRYIYSITSSNFSKFATDEYIPVFANSTIVSGAYTYTGVEVVPIVNTGAGYDAYHSGTIRAKPNTTCLQIESEASTVTNFYQNNAIYITNNNSPTGELITISSYVSNSSGNWVILSEAANTDNITPGITNYSISPRVLFDTDGDETPKAYTVVSNTSNSIANVVIIDPGYGITRANASIVTSVVSPVSAQANVYCIVPPPAGHGSRPESELHTQGLSFSMVFSGNEGSTIPTNIQYNKIGIVKNPYILNANNTKGSAFTSNSFSAVLEANVSGFTFTVGDEVAGVDSGARGIVAFANSTVVYLIGDKHFTDDESIENQDGDTGTISINTLGDIYTKDLVPLYYRNITDVSRDDDQVESFKLIIEL